MNNQNLVGFALVAAAVVGAALYFRSQQQQPAAPAPAPTPPPALQVSQPTQQQQVATTINDIATLATTGINVFHTIFGGR